MKNILGLLVTLGLCFAFTGCGVDELKKEVENKNMALNKCEADKTALNRKVQELTAAVTAKEGETKAAQASLAEAQQDFASAKAVADSAKAEIEIVRAELAKVQAQLKECTDAAAAAAEAAAKKSKKK